MLLSNQYSKNGEKTNLSNYRPISIATGFATIIETVIFKRLNDNIVTQNIIPTAVWIPEWIIHRRCYLYTNQCNT
jgi:hypothetical protein